MAETEVKDAGAQGCEVHRELTPSQEPGYRVYTAAARSDDSSSSHDDEEEEVTVSDDDDDDMVVPSTADPMPDDAEMTPEERIKELQENKAGC